MAIKYECRIRFVKGTVDKWDEYVKVFENSALYDHYFKDKDYLREWMYGPLEKGNVIVAETEDEGEPVGIMVYDMMGMFGEFPYLALLGVKENYRKQAVGSRLVDLYIDICKQACFDKCFICVSHFNPRAKSLYQRKGFTPLVLIPDLIEKGINEWMLVKRL